MAVSSNFFQRFIALEYDHPWHTYPYVCGLFFLAISIIDWGAHSLLGWGPRSFLSRIAFGAIIALFVHYRDRRREARSRQL